MLLLFVCLFVVVIVIVFQLKVEQLSSSELSAQLDKSRSHTKELE